MDIDEKQLVVLSNEVKQSIEQLPIVTPSLYKSIFDQYAKENHLEIEDESSLSEELEKETCEKFTQLQEQTFKNANSLSDSTSKAIDAIQNKDDTGLQQILKETQQLRQEIEGLKASLYRDELTHALNRKWLRDKCLQSGSNSFSQSGVLAIIDLNYFKEINDTYGHIIGDKVLIFILNELKKLNSPVIRYGGDEFIILFDSSFNIEKAKKVLTQLREKMISKKLKAHHGATFTVSFSFGVAAFKDNDSLSETIEEADKNMYVDKLEIKKRVTGI